MSMSKKLTFSLASLVLILGLVFATAPAMAQDDVAVLLTGVGIIVDVATAGDADTRFTVISVNEITGVIDTPITTGDTSIPDLEERLLTGTTIALLAPAATQLGGTDAMTTVANAVQAKDVVISEIMWALDTNAQEFGNQANQQWIELYNTTLTSSAKGAIDTIPLNAGMGGWFLYFVDTHDKIPKPVEAKVGTIEKVKNVVMLDLLDTDDPDVAEPYILVDMVSNLAGGGWTVVSDAGTYGQSGKIKQSGTDTTAAVDLVSMYRKINYGNVTKDHAKDKLADNRKAQTDAIPGGGGSGGWAKSTRAFDTNLIGTPGKRHFKGPVSLLSASPVDRSKVIVNEIGNSETAGQDWVEFRNMSATEPYNLKNHHLSHVKGHGDEASLINFKDTDAWIPAGGVLLVLASDPLNDAHPIAAGLNIKSEGVTWDASAKEYDIDVDTEHLPNGVKSFYYVDDGFDVPDGDTLIILRNAHDKLKQATNLLDVNGGRSIEDRSTAYATNLWPLKKTGAAHGNTVDGSGRKFPPGFVYQKNNAGGGTGDKHWAKRGYTGIGYKLVAANNGANGGTPGYANGAVKAYDKKADHADYKAAPVTISEIMYHTGRNLPQWIELYNHSLTDGVSLDGWTLVIENDRDAFDVPIRTPKVTLEFSGGKIILPNQTILIVTTAARRHSSTDSGKTHFPDHRTINIWDDDGTDRDPLEIESGTSRFALSILSQTGFKLTLRDKAEVVVDRAGNLGEEWDLPTSEDRDGNRHSIIRRYDTKNEARGGTMPIGLMLGAADADADAEADALTDVDYGWLMASEYTLSPDLSGDTYFGSTSDVGTPGYRRGGPLPVSLSKFRPERLESGAVVIRWITESELNNAGFNILRSETRNGEFTKLNAQMIAGQGTSSERELYEYSDTTAKPNVVYYYQIQDVSLDGRVQTLRQTRLKGDVSATGKVTTTWGDLKLQY